MMDTDNFEECHEVFSQDGVLLKQATATYMPFINTIGTLYLTEFHTDTKKRFLEWKPNDVTVDSDVQDQEWAVVNTIQKRTRTLSGSLPPDYPTRLKALKMDFDDIKSFRVQNKFNQLTFLDGKSDVMCKFVFQHGNCERLVTVLKTMLKTAPAKRDKNLFIVLDQLNLEMQQLNKSFAELNIQQDGPTFWRLMQNLKEQPLESALEAFAKVSDYVYRSPDQRELDNADHGNISRCAIDIENRSNFEVIVNERTLPERSVFTRGQPMDRETWKHMFGMDGAIQEVDGVKVMIFRGGVNPSIRQEVWKYLLGYIPWDTKEKDRQKLIDTKNDDYYKMKYQWRTLSKIQEENFADYRDRKSLIEKDVNRTDRNLNFFAGDDNPNLQMLNDILLTYVMYNFDLGYVQGMSDLLSPILQLLESESEAFWCFVGFMNKVSTNFDKSQKDMLKQLKDLYQLLRFVEPDLANYLDRRESGNMFFCFRWLLVWFKRELSQEDVMRFWEILWTEYPCKNFHLLVSVAILETEKKTLIDGEYGFNEILKHINELSGRLDIYNMINKAEGMFYQIKESKHLNDSIRSILGLPLEENINSPEEDTHVFSNGDGPTDCFTVSPEGIEDAFERSLELNFS